MKPIFLIPLFAGWISVQAQTPGTPVFIELTPVGTVLVERPPEPLIRYISTRATACPVRLGYGYRHNRLESHWLLQYPRRDLSQLYLSKGGTETENEGIRFNASRNAPLLFVDGVKMRVNTLPPLNAIASVWAAYRPTSVIPIRSSSLLKPVTATGIGNVR